MYKSACVCVCAAGSTSASVQVSKVDEERAGGQPAGASAAGGRSRSVPPSQRGHQRQPHRGLQVIESMLRVNRRSLTHTALAKYVF